MLIAIGFINHNMATLFQSLLKKKSVKTKKKLASDAEIREMMALKGSTIKISKKTQHFK